MISVGIFSGTFDPVHNGHLQFARDALVHGSLDKIFLLPEARPRRKQGVKSIEHRMRMVQLAVADDLQLGVIILEQPRFTPHDTLPLLKARFQGAKLHMLMGDDMLKHLGDWPHVEQLVSAIHFIIGVRGDHGEAINRIKAIERARGVNFQYQIFSSTLSGVSSSSVKNSLRKKGRSDDVPPNVLAYIKEQGLYSKTAS